MSCVEIAWPEVDLNRPIAVIPLDPTRPCSLFNCILADDGTGSLGTYNWIRLFNAIVEEQDILAYSAAMRRMLGDEQYEEIVRAMDRHDELLAAGVSKEGLTSRVWTEIGKGALDRLPALLAGRAT